MRRPFFAYNYIVFYIHCWIWQLKEQIHEFKRAYCLLKVEPKGTLAHEALVLDSIVEFRGKSWISIEIFWLSYHISRSQKVMKFLVIECNLDWALKSSQPMRANFSFCIECLSMHFRCMGKITSLTDGFSLWLRMIGLGFLSLVLFIFIFVLEKTESSFPVAFSILREVMFL